MEPGAKLVSIFARTSQLLSGLVVVRRLNDRMMLIEDGLESAQDKACVPVL